MEELEKGIQEGLRTPISNFNIDHIKVEETETKVFFGECNDTMNDDDYLIDIKQELGNTINETEECIIKHDNILSDDKAETCIPICSTTNGRKRVSLTLQQKHEVIQMLDNGKSYAKIAQVFGIAASSVAVIKKNKEIILQFEDDHGPKEKQKHVTLTLHQKHEIIQLLDRGKSYMKISQMFGISKSTVADIKKKKEKLLEFISRMEHGPGKRKTLKISINPATESALYVWFVQQRRLNEKISVESITAKARFFHEKITNFKYFNASRDWLQRFKRRHGIRQLNITKEKLCQNNVSEELFREKLHQLINDKHFTYRQIYNADESVLFWRALPDKTLTSAPDRKVSKDRITFMPCANALGDHKLRLLVIGKAKKPCGFGSSILPVAYQNQLNAWMNKQIFLDWFNKEFIPSVRQHMRKNNLEPEAVLLLNNTPGHPSEEELTSDDGKIFAMFLPSNCDQPMDQNVIQSIKLLFRKKILTKIISQQEDGNEQSAMLENINMKDVVFDLATSWDEVTENIIQKSWNLLLPILDSNDDSENDISISLLLNRIKDAEPLDEKAAIEWAQGGAETELMAEDMLTDEEIIALETKYEEKLEESDNSESKVKAVSHIEALEAFNKCIDWAYENNVSTQLIQVLHRIRDNVITKKISNIKQKSVLHLPSIT